MAHILVVDDDKDLCTMLKTALERDGHQVSVHLNGAEVDQAACRWADCILLDVMMPGEDGVCPVPADSVHDRWPDFVFDRQNPGGRRVDRAGHRRG